jgi:hypothetical protein
VEDATSATAQRIEPEVLLTRATRLIPQKGTDSGQTGDQGYCHIQPPSFPGGPGNTEKDPERFTSLMDDLERKVFGPLPDETWVYPGHGKDTTLGVERPHLYEWRKRGW